MISIIIPTYTNAAGLAACLKSVRAQTPPTPDGQDYEVVVVANGAPSETRAALGVSDRALWFDEPIGYTRAVNEGVKACSAKDPGDTIVLLNDDCVVLGSNWLELLLKPMREDPQLGLTGPQKEHDSNSHRNFLIFFCVAIRRACWDAVGGLDEAFNPGFGEDTDFCIRAEGAGWRWKQVPSEEGHFLVDKPGDTTLPTWKQTKMWVSDYPIYHDGEQTFGKLESTGPLLDRNRLLLRLRHDLTVDIGKALAIGGWMSVEELRWLAIQAAERHVVVEVGSWHGRSSRAIADHLPPGGVLYCIDTFNGSSGEPGFHETAKLREGDDAYLRFCENLADHLAAGRVKVLRMTSANAAALLAKWAVQPEMIFIDGDHSRPGIDADLEQYTPLLAPGGLICGHDYFKDHQAWMQVFEGVNAHFEVVTQAPGTSIWIGGSTARRRAVFDCFPFFNELDALELRLAELDPVVDRFVIAEGTLTYQGQPKPLYFDQHKARFAKYLHKITHVVVNDFPVTDDPWVRERWQRDATGRGLFGCQRDDIVIVADVDEIPSADAVRRYEPSMGLVRLQQRLFYGYADLEDPRGWDWCKIAPYHLVRERTACGIRYPEASQVPILEHGGWHFSFMGGPLAWITKLEATAHREYNRPDLKIPEVLLARAAQGLDILGRGTAYAWVDELVGYPAYLMEHFEQFDRAGWFLRHAPAHALIGAPMHTEAHQFVESVRTRFPDRFHGRKVLEVGALNINGTVRDLFTDCDYLGIDVAEGPGVDRVVLAHELLAPDTYDVVVSTEALEHDRHWEATLAQMYANLKPGGLLVITCAGPSRREHGTTRTDTYSSPHTTDYYRNLSVEDIRRVLPVMNGEVTLGRGEQDVYAYGFKPFDPATLRDVHKDAKPEPGPRPLTVTATVSTKDRYTTTLPMTLLAIAQQTRPPERVEIYDDGEQKDLRQLPPFDQIFRLFDLRGIRWEFFATPRQGQVANHQHALETAQSDLIWRVDDDEAPAPDCLKELLKAMGDDVGAVAGLVLVPGQVAPAPTWLDGSLAQIDQGPNLQWCQWNGGPRDVEHLYSTFLYRVEAGRKAGGYPANLSRIGHREETLFTHQIQRQGYRLVVTPHAITWHFQQAGGGIRTSDSRREMWQHDEDVFTGVLASWDVHRRPSRLVVLDCGIGDHYAFFTAFPRIRAAHPDTDYILAVCYPEIFPGERLLSIADALQLIGKDGVDKANFYRWMWDHQWTRTLPEAWEEMYR